MMRWVRWVRWVGRAVVGAALLGCEAPEEPLGPCGMTRMEFEIDGQRGLLLMPPELEEDGEAPLVLYHHGRGEDWHTIETGLAAPELSCALGASGYMIAASHAHGNNWGSEQAVADYVKLYRAIAAQRRIRGVMFLSVSMGGLTGLVTLARGLIPDVRAWAGIYPVTNLGYAYFEDERTTGQVEKAYRGPPSPEQDPSVIDPARFRGIPMLIWASDEDTRVPMAENAVRFLERLGNPSNARLIVTEGEHGDPSNFDPAELVAFFDLVRRNGRTR